MKLKNWIAAAFGAAAVMAAGPASATAVGLELMLLVDVSGSVDSAEYDLQKNGYVNAFNSVAVQNAILASQGGAIAVTYIEWSGNTQRATQVGWTLINSVASAQQFATALSGVSRAFAGNTAIPDAIVGRSAGLAGPRPGGSGGSTCQATAPTTTARLFAPLAAVATQHLPAVWIRSTASRSSAKQVCRPTTTVS